MIRHAKEQDKRQIADLWETVFCDTRREINLYLDRFLNCIIVCEQDGQIIGMLSLLPITCGDIQVKYIYAVAVHPSYRLRGIASALLEEAEKEERFLVLVPAEKSLFEFYRKRGFSEMYCTSRRIFFAHELPKSTALPQRITPERLLRLRRKAFEKYDFLEWDENCLGYISEIYDNEIYAGADFYAVCAVCDDTVYIKELCGEDIVSAVSALNNIFNKNKYVITLPEKSTEPSAVQKGLKLNNPYFNLAMD